MFVFAFPVQRQSQGKLHLYSGSTAPEEGLWAAIDPGATTTAF